jgi:shikimate kinase
MGSGKSAVGRRLAAELGLEFHDSDEKIEASTGVDIPFIFDKEGEPGFRKREALILAELAGLQNIVLATGGGAPVDPANRALLAGHGRVVYLYTSVAEQLRRTAKSRHRPLLHVDDPGAVLEKLMAERDPLYREIADIVVATDGRHVNTVTREVKARLAELAEGD